MNRPEGHRVSDFDYELPRHRIARYPSELRDHSRLMVVDRETGEISHARFGGVVDLIRSPDLLVVNESRVIPARLLGKKPTGAPAEVLLLRPAGSGEAGSSRDWEALVRPGGKLKPGRTVIVSEDLTVRILDGAPGGGRIVRLETDLEPMDAIDRYGHVPLPPYLERPDEALDRERYQTVYARTPGSVAAPTAGLHFTSGLLAALEGQGVRTARITLHVGPGTFRPLDTDDPDEHHMHEESYMIPSDTADAIEATRAAGGRVWAVGTTVVRTLESAAGPGGEVRPSAGTTDLFIRPPHEFGVVDALLTNFHLPRSTLLMLVAAFGGYDLVMSAYETAVAEEYRFYSYGDAMAIV